MFAYIVIEQYTINIYKCLLYVYLFIVIEGADMYKRL